MILNEHSDGDSWQPTAGPAVLRLRARLCDRIRTFFAATGALEVDTPVLVRTVPAEPHIRPVCADVAGRRVCLRTSPEAAMKRLLAAGAGDCWQLGPVFRDGEVGRWHQPEFRMLEWYRVGVDHHELMDDVEALLSAALAAETTIPPARRLTYREAFVRCAGIDPLADETSALRVAAERCGHGEVSGLDDDDRDGWLDWLLAAVVIPALDPAVPVFIHAWPAGQAALARLDPDDPRVASRFELYWQGVELANGFHELIDAVEQRARLEGAADAGVPLDTALLGALEAGLPDCAGVALGFDRLVMLAAGAERLDEVVSFPLDRA